MSNLTPADLSVVSSLLDHFRGAGYVLDFTDREFSHYFGAEFDIDIDDPIYEEHGRSKGKRLRSFLQRADGQLATRVLRSLWQQRQTLLAGEKDPIAKAEEKYRALLEKLGGACHAPRPAPPRQDMTVRDHLKAAVASLAQLKPQERGYAFEKFLKGVFELNGLDPRGSFRNRGEQIDGSFSLSNSTYLLEAKWQAAQIGASDLHAFEGKLREKAIWARGLYVSFVGFTDDGLHAFGRGKRTLCMDGHDLYEMLDRNLRLDQVLDAKARRAAESGLTFVRVRDLF